MHLSRASGNGWWRKGWKEDVPSIFDDKRSSNAVQESGLVSYPRRDAMLLRGITATAALVVVAAPSSADPGDQWKKQLEKRAECDKKLYEAKSRRDFYKKANECNRELAKLNQEQRREAAKEWREAEKKWRERHRDYHGDYYDRDDRVASKPQADGP
jgi:hypothetical protein